MALFPEFTRVHGRPTERTPSSVSFTFPQAASLYWDDFLAEAGAGVYADGFLHVATPELPAVSAALQGWSWLLPDGVRPQVVARNAWGDLALLWHDETDTDHARVLSLRRAALEHVDPRGDLVALFNFYLTSTERIPSRPTEHPFLDDALFRAWRAAGGTLTLAEALVPTLPFPLGGTMDLGNLVKQDLAVAVAEIGEIYRRAVAR